MITLSPPNSAFLSTANGIYQSAMWSKQKPKLAVLFFVITMLSTTTGCGGSDGNTQPTASTPTPAPASTPRPVPTATPAPTSSPSIMPTAQPTATPEPSPEPVPTAEPLIPDSSADPELPKPGDDNYALAVAAARFLTQASFGPTAKSIVATMNTSREEWLNEQIALPQTYHLALLDQRLLDIGLEPAPAEEDDQEGWVRDLQRSDIWWESAIWGKDQLRQKVAYALSQILVISNVSDVLFNDSRGIANYHDILAEHAFGNYRDLLKAITLNPIMGEYLSMIRNEKANTQRNIRPDENYARELMQLFSIGLVELNIDGSPVLDNDGRPVPTYDQDDIKALARVFTGWNHSTISNWWQWTSSGASEVTPMKSFANYHDSDEKVLFESHTIPASQSAEDDIDSALNILFAHQNVGPFISKQLIQHLVTSNPSPAYVSRVATVFNNNGNNTKGDMAAVIKAILTDDEAINGHTQQADVFGKLREPILKVSALWRAFKAQGVPVGIEGSTIYPNRLRFRGSDRELGQRPYGSFSVFNFYRPDYQQPGDIKQQGLLSPEFQIMTDSHLITATSYLSFTTFWRDTEGSWPKTELVGPDWDIYPTQLYLAEEKSLGNKPAELLDRINLLLMSGQMSLEMYNELLTYLTPYANGSREQLVYDAITLTAASAEFSVQR